MTLQTEIKKQRVKHIVNSYQLEGEDAEACATELNDLFQTYAPELIELALAETIALNWLTVPMPRGLPFFTQVRSLLDRWQAESIQLTLTPAEFEQLTGLSAEPISGMSDNSPRIAQPQ